MLELSKKDEFMHILSPNGLLESTLVKFFSCYPKKGVDITKKDSVSEPIKQVTHLICVNLK